LETANIPGLSQLYDLERDLDERIDRRRKEGKNTFDLLDPSKPEYVGTAEALSPYADEALRQTLEDRARHLSAAAAASAEHFEREATPAELAGARDALRQGADHRSVIRRFNARAINFSRL
jgi:flagellar biosynthesis/type III secretory pathway protein FliH